MNENQKFVVGDCPKCGAAVVYSDDPKDKMRIKVIAVGNQYRGMRHLCSKCKTMYAIVGVPLKSDLSLLTSTHA